MTAPADTLVERLDQIHEDWLHNRIVTGEHLEAVDEAAARIRELEAAAQHAIVNCGKCWGNGHHYNSKDDKVDCKVCAPLRAALKESK